MEKGEITVNPRNHVESKVLDVLLSFPANVNGDDATSFFSVLVLHTHRRWSETEKLIIEKLLASPNASVKQVQQSLLSAVLCFIRFRISILIIWLCAAAAAIKLDPSAKYPFQCEISRSKTNDICGAEEVIGQIDGDAVTNVLSLAAQEQTEYDDQKICTKRESETIKTTNWVSIAYGALWMEGMSMR